MASTEAPKQTVRVSVVGAGYWGKNLVRNYHSLGVLESVCDVDNKSLDVIRKEYCIPTTNDYDAVLSDPVVNAVVIAAPAALHYDLAKLALRLGKHVFVEKPLALHTGEGRELVNLANKQGSVLMVGHILEYHPAIVELTRLIREGHLGKIQYIYSSRLNLGKLRTEENILWSFAPHDISVILRILGELPSRVSAHGGSYINPRIFDTTLTTCDFNSGAKAHIFVSWIHPFKEQKLAIVGGKKMAVFDDTQVDRKLILYS